MRFEGFGPAGVHLMTTHTVIEETPAWYLIQGDFATAGLGALFVSVSNRSVAEGRQTGEIPKPERFDSETARNGVVQHKPRRLPGGRHAERQLAAAAGRAGDPGRCAPAGRPRSTI